MSLIMVALSKPWTHKLRSLQARDDCLVSAFPKAAFSKAYMSSSFSKVEGVFLGGLATLPSQAASLLFSLPSILFQGPFSNQLLLSQGFLSFSKDPGENKNLFYRKSWKYSLSCHYPLSQNLRQEQLG